MKAVIYGTDEKGNKTYFSGFDESTGQPMAQGTLDKTLAKVFPSEKKAFGTQLEWTGAGVGMERFPHVGKLD